MHLRGTGTETPVPVDLTLIWSWRGLSRNRRERTPQRPGVAAARWVWFRWALTPHPPSGAAASGLSHPSTPPQNPLIMAILAPPTLTANNALKNGNNSLCRLDSSWMPLLCMEKSRNMAVQSCKIMHVLVFGVGRKIGLGMRPGLASKAAAAAWVYSGLGRRIDGDGRVQCPQTVQAAGCRGNRGQRPRPEHAG